ncbi:MAG: hypothetical protein HWD61_09460 [Parachlamydiaceae bacterium]|nr:MAG: hypothetical protein HWD61_09460 [Parachlamydiaceae bacterium]
MALPGEAKTEEALEKAIFDLGELQKHVIRGFGTENIQIATSIRNSIELLKGSYTKYLELERKGSPEKF